jgi:hypothetical protein
MASTGLPSMNGLNLGFILLGFINLRKMMQGLAHTLFINQKHSQ